MKTKILKLMLLAIVFTMPMHAENLTVSVTTAGTLESKIKETGIDPLNITSLKVIGPINGDDVIYLRYLAGSESNFDKDYLHETYGVFGTSKVTDPSYYYYVVSHVGRTPGKMHSLDLSNARIVAGGGEYFYARYSVATGGSTTNTYRASERTKDDMIGTYFFTLCEKLDRIILPWSKNGITTPIYTSGSYAVNDYITLKCYFKDAILGPNMEISGWFRHGYSYSNYYVVPNLYCHSATPLTWTWGTNNIATNVYVPLGSGDAYKADAKWKKHNIIEGLQRMEYGSWQSSNKEDNSVSSKTIRMYIPAGSRLEFDYTVSSEVDCDYLTVTLNGKKLVNKSGELSGTYNGTFTSDLDGELLIKYSKDEMSAEGTDGATVSNITLIIPEADLSSYPVRMEGQLALYDQKLPVKSNHPFVVPTLQYRREFTNTNWQSLFVPFAVKYEDWSDLFDVAKITNVHQYDNDDDGIAEEIAIEVVKIKRGELIPNHPYLIKAKSVGNKTLTMYDTTLERTLNDSISCSSMNAVYTFVGTYDIIPGSEMLANEYYALGNGSLHKAEDDTNDLGAFRWYLKIEGREGQVIETPSEVKIQAFGFDDETGIESIELVDDVNAKTYDLNGREVSGNLQRGIYIRNGKKIMVR